LSTEQISLTVFSQYLIKQAPQRPPRVSDRAERPLQTAPKPTLMLAEKGSPYGFPARPQANREALLNTTNALANSNEVIY
jgi:hypothetical protein